MILINYWTSEHFETNVWDKFYCKSKTSARKFLKEYAKIQNMEYWDDHKEIHKQSNAIHTQNNVNISIWDLHINMQEIDLI